MYGIEFCEVVVDVFLEGKVEVVEDKKFVVDGGFYVLLGFGIDLEFDEVGVVVGVVDEVGEVREVFVCDRFEVVNDCYGCVVICWLNLLVMFCGDIVDLVDVVVEVLVLGIEEVVYGFYLFFLFVECGDVG